MSMTDKIIGLVWRYGINDYGIIINEFDEVDQKRLQDIYGRYAEDSSGARGEKNLTLDTCNVDYWESEWAKADMESRRKELAHKLYHLGLVDTSALYDNQADEQLTEEQIVDALKSVKDTSYMLETFMQFCDGNQEEEDHKKFFEASMAIVHYMEDLKGEN